MRLAASFFLGVGLAVLGLLALDQWAERRWQAFHKPPVGDF